MTIGVAPSGNISHKHRYDPDSNSQPPGLQHSTLTTQLESLFACVCVCVHACMLMFLFFKLHVLFKDLTYFKLLPYEVIVIRRCRKYIEL